MPDLVRLERLVRRIAVPRHASNSRGALDAVEDLVALELASTGLRVERHLFTHAGREFHNVLGTRDGTDPARPWVLVGAHFDSTPHTPGADDNASAVAATLEVARLLRAWTPAATVQYVGFNLEEPQPPLASRLGSRAYARKLAADGVRVAGALVLEMVGFTGPQRWVPWSVRLVRRVPREGTFLAVVGDGRSRHLVRALRRAAVGDLPVVALAVPLQGWLLPYSRMSDNARFWDEGMPAVMITDTAFLRNPHYHRLSDTPDTLDYAFMGRVVTTVVRAVMDLAG